MQRTFLTYSGSSLFSDVNLSSPDFPFGDAVGNLDVPQNPGRLAALTGSISVVGGFTPVIPLGFDGQLKYALPVTLVGLFSDCLLAAGSTVPPTGYDGPNYVAFATVNVSIMGLDVFDVSCSNRGLVCAYTGNFTGSAPEPASFSFVIVSGFAAAFLYCWRQGKIGAAGRKIQSPF